MIGGMETMKISHDTRNQRGEAMGIDPSHHANARRAIRPGRRFVIACSVLLAVGLCFILYRLNSGPGSRPAEVPAASASDVPVVPRQNVLLLEDPVCLKPVDPSKTRFVLKFNGQDLYFCSEECMTRFLEDPFKYGRIRLKVTVTRPDGTTTTVPVPAPSSLDPTAVPLDPTPAAQETGLPEGDTGVQLTPEPSPDEGVTPVPSRSGETPSVNEPYPGTTPAPDQPGAAPGLSPVPDSTASPDDNGFSLPPTVETGAPTQAEPPVSPKGQQAPTRTVKPNARPVKKPVARPPTQAPPTGDDPPSVDEPGNGM